MKWRVQGKQDLGSEVVPYGTTQGANKVECVIASFIACEHSQSPLASYILRIFEGMEFTRQEGMRGIHDNGMSKSTILSY